MKTTPHNSVGTMPGGNAKKGRISTVDHGSMGNPIGGQNAPYDPCSPANGRHGVTEGDKGSCNPLPKEKDYSRNGM